MTLPVSALQALNLTSAMEHGPLTFELDTAAAAGGSTVLGRTHAGVAEFVAEEGTVGLPPKSVLSLTKALGVGAKTARLRRRGSAISLRCCSFPTVVC